MLLNIGFGRYANCRNTMASYISPSHIHECIGKDMKLLETQVTYYQLRVGKITRKCGFVNQKIRGQRPSNFLIHKFTISSGFSGLNHKRGHVKTNVYIYMA